MGQLRASITLTPDANPNHKPLSPRPRPTPVPAQASDDPRRRPRIPSYSQQCQSTKPACRDQRLLRCAAGTGSPYPERAQRRVNIGPGPFPVQRPPQKFSCQGMPAPNRRDRRVDGRLSAPSKPSDRKIFAGRELAHQSKPSPRNSAIIAAGIASSRRSIPPGRSGGASAGVR